MKKIRFLLILLIASQLVLAKSQVDTVMIFAEKMQKEVKSVVVKPANYTKNKQYPVLYLLHGYSDNYSKWVNTVPDILDLSTRYGIIIVCPDGGYNSWYFDSTVDPSSQYESYITSDLIGYVDKHYRTISDRNGRAITGLSMGGHGALYLAIRHRDLFAHAGSMSGGVDLFYSTKNWEISQKIGSYEDHPEAWHARSVTDMVESLKNKDLDLIIDCGVNDFFYGINAKLHRKLIDLKIDHDYIERPGVHNWEYWTNSIQYQMLFFHRCFTRQ